MKSVCFSTAHRLHKIENTFKGIVLAIDNESWGRKNTLRVFRVCRHDTSVFTGFDRHTYIEKKDKRYLK